MDDDADDDGMPDSYELIYGFDPSNPNDAFGDQDNDGLTNVKEYQIGTNPVQQDTDGDCADDGDEIQQGTDPLVQEVQTLNLRHVINILEVLTGITPESMCPGVDADENGTVEIKDAIQALRSVAGVR